MNHATVFFAAGGSEGSWRALVAVGKSSFPQRLQRQVPVTVILYGPASCQVVQVALTGALVAVGKSYFHQRLRRQWLETIIFEGRAQLGTGRGRFHRHHSPKHDPPKSRFEQLTFVIFGGNRISQPQPGPQSEPHG